MDKACRPDKLLGGSDKLLGGSDKLLGGRERRGVGQVIEAPR